MGEITGQDFLEARVKNWIDHPGAASCPECGGDCKRTALTQLIYTFEVCSCGKPEYPHLIEQLHHRNCYEEAVCHRFGTELAKH